MPRLSYDELDVAYRRALRTIVQERARGDAYAKAFRRAQGRLLAAVQWIGDAAELIEREHRKQQLGHELDAIASADVRVTPITGDSSQ